MQSLQSRRPLLTFTDRFAYCIKVYLKNAWSDDNTETQTSTGLPSYTNSVQTRSARAVYRRVRKVVWLQWRGIAIVVFILVDVIFFSVIFVYLNSVESHAVSDLEKATPFLLCLMQNRGPSDKCFGLGQALFVNQSTVIAILIMLSVSRLQLFINAAIANVFKAGGDSSLPSPSPILHVHSMGNLLGIEVRLKA